ncbi:MAG: hypothetical protein HY924_09120 [Elusimicrobia bacterium]|nr:hypothetical protein [Elusimicrobiota bacterium]
MEESPKPRRLLPKDSSEIEAIADLQTARLALRWALERIRAVESERDALRGKSETESREKRAALEDLRALQRTFNYYAAKLQESEVLAKTLAERLETARAEAAPEEAPAAPSREDLESPEVGAGALSLRQSYKERLSALKAEHAAELEALKKSLEEAASRTVRKVQVLAQEERERLEHQVAHERESRRLALASLESRHRAELAALAESIQKRPRL